VKKILYIHLKTLWDIKLHVHPKNDEFWLTVSVFPLEIAHTTLNTQVRIKSSNFKISTPKLQLLQYGKQKTLKK
jgi:hypothetical protein